MRAPDKISYLSLQIALYRLLYWMIAILIKQESGSKIKLLSLLEDNSYKLYNDIPVAI